MFQRIQQLWQAWSVRRRILCVVAVLAIAAVLFLAFDCRLTVRHYEIDAPEISSPIRIALITDLHSCYYGKDQQDLIRAIDIQAPDLILLGGDIFDDEVKDTNTELFLVGIAGRYPCYYVTGNHECWSGDADFARKMGILEQYGVTILSGVCENISIRGQSIDLCGVDDPDSYLITSHETGTFSQQLASVAAQTRDGHFSILLSHRPEAFDRYVAGGFDLVLCGHAHGGQWRIPGILNGLFAPNQGLFPKYAGGKYESGNTTMIVSRGLARESTFVPRIFNPPELVILTIG